MNILKAVTSSVAEPEPVQTDFSLGEPEPKFEGATDPAPLQKKVKSLKNNLSSATSKKTIYKGFFQP